MKKLADRWFEGDLRICKEVKLTKEEIKLFENFELEVVYCNGLKNINGGWSAIYIEEIDEDDETGNEILRCIASCGVADECGRSSESWWVIYDRITKKFKGENDDS